MAQPLSALLPRPPSGRASGISQGVEAQLLFMMRRVSDTFLFSAIKQYDGAYVAHCGVNRDMLLAAGLPLKSTSFRLCKGELKEGLVVTAAKGTEMSKFHLTVDKVSDKGYSTPMTLAVSDALAVLKARPIR